MNWFKKQVEEVKKELTTSPVESYKQSVTETIEEIHSSFDTAADRLLKEAQEIINTPVSDNCEVKKALGFTNAKGVAENEQKIQSIATNRQILDNLNYFSQQYPQYKFIHKDQIINICKKYNLLLGDSSAYTGDIPLKNLEEIGKFVKSSIKDEDCTYYANYFKDYINFEKHKEYIKIYEQRDVTSYYYFSYKEEAFNICAPIADMKINSRQQVVNNQIVNIPDPIVLFPVRDNFYIIVSKWGLEGQDEALTNEKMN